MSTTITTIDVPISSPGRNPSGTTTSIQITTKPTAEVNIPNYLRASIGSCHDFCKFGLKRNPLPALHTTRNQGKPVAAPVLLQEDRAKKGKKGLPSARLMIHVPMRKPAIESKRKGPASNAVQSTVRQINRTVVKTSSSNVRRSCVEAFRDIRSSTRNSLPSRSSSPSSSFSSSRLPVKSLPAENRASKSIVEKVSQTGTKSGVKKSPAKSRSSKSAVENPETEKQKSSKGHVLENQVTEQQYSSLNENNKMDSAEERTVRGTMSGRVIMQENEASLRKLRFRKPSVVEHQRQNASPLRLRSRRVISNREPTHTKGHTIKAELNHSEVVVRTISDSHLMNKVIEETASRLVQKRMNKVKALVGAFESLIKTNDFESLRRS